LLETPAMEVPVKLHARLGPSSSDIWLTCLGAPAEWEKYPPKRVGYAAHEGTLAHTLCEAALLTNQIPWTEGMNYTVEGSEILVTNDMLNAVSLYATLVSTLSDIALWRIIEKQVSFGWLWGANAPVDLFGTSDFACTDGTVLYVIDFKYGSGKAVKVEGNTQLLLYALGAWGELRRDRPDLADTIDTVCLVVVQPRAGGEPVRQWSIPLAELVYWAYATLKPSIDKILSGVKQPLVPGAHCYFCAASHECPAYRRHKVQKSVESFPDYVEPDLV
jgi:Protein of unknown function (DUF2800)